MFNAIQYFIIILIGILQLAFQCALILVLFKKELYLKNILIFSFVVTLVHQIPMSLFPVNNIMISLILYIIVCMLGIKHILKFNFTQALLAAFILFVVSMIIEYVGMAILKISFGNRYDSIEWSKSFLTGISMRILGILLIFMIFMVLYFLKIQLSIPNNMDRKRIAMIIISILMTLLFIIPNILFFVNSIPDMPTSIYIFNAMSLLFFLFFYTYSSLKLCELDMKSQQIEFQNLYINTLNETVNGLRSFKHDFNNIIQVIGGYLQLNNIEGLKKYYKQILGEVRKVNNTMPLNSYLNDFPGLYGLLLSKMSFSEINNIVFDIHILTEINIKNIKTLDFYKIIGILLDNAFEAALECDEGKVELIIGRDNNSLVIEIRNSCYERVNTEKIFESGYTTKKDHMGFGLFEVKNIIKKYNNISLDTSVIENTFIQRLIIS
jgi:two-component system sensor histidine kinase AgrC